MTREDVLALLGELERGEVRAASPDANGDWVANAAVKEGILAAFHLGVEESSEAGPLHFRDRDTLPPRRPLPEGVRVVPGGTALRSTGWANQASHHRRARFGVYVTPRTKSSWAAARAFTRASA